MSLTTDLKKTATDTGEALVGLVDLTVEKVRDARGQVQATRRAITHVDPLALQKELVKQVQEAPSFAVRTGRELVGKVHSDARSTVDSLEARGDSLLTRLRTQRATKDLVKQVDTTIAVGRGAVTTARKAVDSTTSSAKATLTTARKEADTAADVVVETAQTVKSDVEQASPEVKATVKRTRTAAKRTGTTARKATERTTSRAKATRTTAKKTTAAAAKAVADGAEKVGS